MNNLSNRDAYINAKEVRKMLGGISSATLWRMESKGQIPRGRRVTPSTILWNIDEVRAAIDATQTEKGAANER